MAGAARAAGTDTSWPTFGIYMAVVGAGTGWMSAGTHSAFLRGAGPDTAAPSEGPEPTGPAETMTEMA
ncbi:hypothetical protein K4B79_10055 [Streptomyces lincolnensis]|uniref:hypothetical protein n=1 Tax=Streptomyces lincolnensis TaxID=1915 RepID=UPI001E4CF9FB|nr:hypothetical protein [Streptomyces lincolnensis]MCD7438576.1 hypothetical protein [Streptomyces lincolnensis]